MSNRVQMTIEEIRDRLREADNAELHAKIARDAAWEVKVKADKAYDAKLRVHRQIEDEVSWLLDKLSDAQKEKP